MNNTRTISFVYARVNSSYAFRIGLISSRHLDSSRRYFEIDFWNALEFYRLPKQNT